MNTTLVLPYGTNLVEEVSRHLVADETGFGRALVIFPGKRPAHFLRKVLAERVGSAYLPPRIFSMDSFVEFVYRETLGKTAKDMDAADAVAILHDVYQAMPRRIAGKRFDALDAFFPLGVKMFAELEEVAIAIPSETALRSGLGPVLIGNELPLETVYREFYRLVEEASLITRAMKYAQVASHLAPEHLAGYGSIVAAGFFALTRAEEAIFSALAATGCSTFLFQQGRGLGKQLQKLRIQAEFPSDPGNAPCVHFYRSPDQHGQVFGLAGKLEEQYGHEGKLDERTVVVLPSSDALSPVFQHALPIIHDQEYNVSLGYPVTRTPVYGFLNALMQVLASADDGKLYAPDYVKFILHPYTKNILLNGRSDVTRILVHIIEDHLARWKSGTFFQPEEIENDSGLFAAVVKKLGADEDVTPQQLQEHLISIHRRTIGTLQGARDVRDVAQRCMEILVYIDEQSTANRHPLFEPYVGTMIESLDGLARSLLGSHRFADPTGYHDLIRGTLEPVEVPFAGTPVRGLQVLGFLETRSLQFDTVHILDMNDDVIPGGTGHRTLIPRGVRETLGLPTSHDKAAIAGYYCDVLIRAARHVHIFHTENGTRERSRFVEQIMWEQEQAAGTSIGEGEVSSVGYSVRLGNSPPEPITKLDEYREYLQQFVFSATALDTYLRCPLRFYYRHVLNLTEEDEVAGEIEAKDIGNLVHGVLRTFFQPMLGRPLVPDDLNESRLDQVVEEHFLEQFGSHPLGARDLVKSQVQKQLKRFLATYQKRMIQLTPVVILDLERQIRDVRKRGLSFRGRLDRIERRGDSIVILDYKTGGNEGRLRVNFKKLDPSNRMTWGDAIGSLQLPLYALLYSAQTGISPAEISPAFLLLGRNDMGPGAEMRLYEDDDQRDARYLQLEEIIFGLIDEIMDPAIPFVPTNNFEAECPTCPFTGFCGTQWAAGGRGREG